VHYAGIACDIHKIMALAAKYNLLVIEDAAQFIDSYYTVNGLIIVLLRNLLIIFYVKELNEVIGFVTVKNNVNFSTIELIALDENHQGKGIGKKMVLKVE
jgi:hypothetical protein